MTLLVDTSALYALLDHDDPNHQSAKAALTVMDIAPPPGVNVPGAHWIKDPGNRRSGQERAGGGGAPSARPRTLSPRDPLHGSGAGLKDIDVEWAARLAADGFVAVAGCWPFSTVPPNTIQVFELTLTRIACPRLPASEADAIAALIEVGRKQPGVRTDAVGLSGV